MKTRVLVHVSFSNDWAAEFGQRCRKKELGFSMCLCAQQTCYKRVLKLLIHIFYNCIETDSRQFWSQITLWQQGFWDRVDKSIYGEENIQSLSWWLENVGKSDLSNRYLFDYNIMLILSNTNNNNNTLLETVLLCCFVWFFDLFVLFCLKWLVLDSSLWLMVWLCSCGLFLSLDEFCLVFNATSRPSPR